MLKGLTEKGELKNIRVSENGELLTKGVGGQSSNIGNTEDNPVPVKVIDEVETTLQAGVITVGTEATTISINKKVTGLSIANYSETADITVTVGEKQYTVGANLAIDLPINSQVTDITIVSSEADTKVQYVAKGVE